MQGATTRCDEATMQDCHCDGRKEDKHLADVDPAFSTSLGMFVHRCSSDWDKLPESTFNEVQKGTSKWKY
jgi:hypothetical protein